MNLSPPEPLEAVLRKHGCSELLSRDLSDASPDFALIGPRQHLEREYLFAKDTQSVPPDELAKVVKISDHFVFATGEPPFETQRESAAFPICLGTHRGRRSKGND